MADELRKLTEDLELRALADEYDGASPDDRERILQALVQKLGPERTQLVEQSKSDPDVLRSMLIHCQMAFLERQDISDLDRRLADGDVADFLTALRKIEQADPDLRDLAIELAINTLFAGLRVGLAPDEVERLRRSVPAELGRMGGKAHKRDRDWKTKARDIAQENVGATSAQITSKILNFWKDHNKKPPVTDRTILRFLAKLRKDGCLPPRQKKRLS